MDKATKSKFRISRSGRLGAAGPQFYDVGTIINFLKIYADADSSGDADGDYAAYLEKAISSGSTFVRPEDSGQLLEYLQVYTIYYLAGQNWIGLTSVPQIIVNFVMTAREEQRPRRRC